MSPFQFEVRNNDGSRSFVRVLNTFEHLYTKEPMRSIRIDSLLPNSVEGATEWKIINENQYRELVARRITDDQD